MARVRTPKTPFAERLNDVLVVYDDDFPKEKLAERLGVSFGTLQNYRRGERNPNVEFLETLKGLSGVNIEWLVTGEGIAFDPEKLDVPVSAAAQMNMKDGYVKAIVDRLIQVHSKTDRPINQELFWWVVTTVHQEFVERFDGADASADEMEPILDAFIDQQAKKAGW